MKRHLRRGQSMVEMALLFPVLILILFGTIDFGYYIFSYATIQSAARRGAEQATRTPPDVQDATAGTVSTSGTCVSQIKTEAVVGTWPLSIDPNNIGITYMTTTGGGVSNAGYPASAAKQIGQVIEVKVTYTMNWLTPLGPLFHVPNTKTIVAASRRSILTAEPGC